MLSEHAARAQNQSNGPPDSEEQRRQIFEQIFGKRGTAPVPPGAPYEPELPVVLDDGEEIGSVVVRSPEDPEHARIAGKPLLTLLGKVLQPKPLAVLQSSVAADGTLGFGDLGAAGVAVEFDPARAALALSIPQALRRIREISLRGAVPTADAANLVRNADFSSVINLRAGVDYIHQSGASNSPGVLGFQPLNIALESATNYRNTVFLADLNYQQGAPVPLQRGDVSLVRDDPDAAIRYQLGDLTYPVDGFQAFQTMAGFGFSRNFALQPYKVYQPEGQEQISLQSASRVDVLVNGVRTQTLQLAPGRYDLTQFPFAQGVNDVELKITDAVGRVSTISVPFFFSADLLAPGEQQFSYAVGAPSTTEGSGARQYQLGTPALSAFHRVGVTDFLTLGGSFQGDRVQQMADGNVAFASGFGNVRIDGAASQAQGFGTDFAARLLYNYTDAPLEPGARPVPFFGESRAIFGSATYTGKRFASLGTLTPDNTGSFGIQGGISQPLILGVTGGLGGSYQFSRPGARDTNNLTLSLRRYFGSAVSTDIELSRTVQTTGAPDYRALFTVQILFSQAHQQVTTSYDTDQHATQLDWQYLPTSDVDDPFVDLNLTRGHDTTEASGTLSYNTQRIETLLVHDETLPNFSGNQSSLERVSSVRVGTALAFADGTFAVSRPIGDAFAIVAKHPSLADYRVGVEPTQNGGFEAAPDWLGPAVISNVPSYQVQSLTAGARDLPPGYDLGSGFYQLEPRFHSGAVITLGSDANVLLDGELHDQLGTPLALVAGEARPADEHGDAKPFFTNRTGRFRIDGLRPAAYDLVFPALGDATIRVDIPPNTSGIDRIGVLTISVKAQP
jgi:outer membrane usher protein